MVAFVDDKKLDSQIVDWFKRLTLDEKVEIYNKIKQSDVNVEKVE